MNVNRFFFLFLFMCLSLCTSCQQLREVGTIDTELDENSGMYVQDSNNIWLHNDSGGEAKLYKIDSSGIIRGTVVIRNAINVDWEDLAKDSLGNIYIGDFGNNQNNRQNLKIYKIPSPGLYLNDSVSAQVIEFTYPDQQQFPPPAAVRNFDMEAMVVWKDSVYLFSKDRSSPHQGYTKLYRLPNQAGSYQAELIDSFYTQTSSLYFSITAASLSPDNSKLALLNANSLWLFRNFRRGSFFKGDWQKINLSSFTQKEALDFISNEELYISDEKSPLGSARLYRIDLPQITTTQAVEFTLTKPIFYPNPIKDRLSIDFTLRQGTVVCIVLYDEGGRKVQNLYKKRLEQGKQHIELPFEQKKGKYIIHIRCKKQIYTQQIIH